MDINTLAAYKIKEIRANLGYTVEAVSKDMGLAKSNYSNLENGKVEITLNKIKALSDIFKMPIEALIPMSAASTINITNGDNSVSRYQYNNYTDKEMLYTIQNTISMLEILMKKIPN